MKPFASRAALFALLQNVGHRRRGFISLLGHLGAPGLFILAVLDSSPLPGFLGPDILTAILAGRHHEAWYLYAAAATGGSMLGAYITYRIAWRAGAKYLERKFSGQKVSAVRRLFHKWQAGALAASCAVPVPFPTTGFFAAAGISKYPLRPYLLIVALARGARYTAIAWIGYRYGAHFVRILLHPSENWGWLLLVVGLIVGTMAGGIILGRRLGAESQS